MSRKITASWDMTPCILVNTSQRFGGTCYLRTHFLNTLVASYFETLVPAYHTTQCDT